MRPRDVERMLERQPMPEPPDGLAERIKAEIPEELELPGRPEPEAGRFPVRRQWRLAAAALVTVALTGVVTWRLSTSEPPPVPVPAAVGASATPAAPVPIQIIMPARRPTPAEAGPPTFPYVREVPTAAAEPVAPAPAPRPTPEGAMVASEAPAVATSGVAGGAPVARHDEDRDLLLEIPRMPAPPPSTGGSREPNDQPYGDVFYRDAGVNPYVDAEDDRLSTFGLEVDTASYTVVRRYLSDGHLPPPEAVRVEELVNAFDYGDGPPERGDFAAYAEGAPSPFGEGPRTYLLRFGIRARVVDPERRPPAVLTFVVDTSGSMERENRLDLVKRALFALLDQLRPDDRVGLVVYGSRGQVLLEPTGDHEAIYAAVNRLVPGGSTNAEEGLVLGYRLASRFRRDGGINRVILCSDGVANQGNTSADGILDRIRPQVAEGIELTTVGFGMGNYNDVLMEQLADKGDGRYAYVDTLAEANRLFVEELAGTLQTIARDAKAQVEFNPAVVACYRLVGYENRAIADRRFRDDTVDAGEIGAGHGVTALYEVTLQERPRRHATLATLRLRYTPTTPGAEPVELERRLRLSDLAGTWAGASPALRLASLVAEYGELLKGSYRAREESFDDVLRRLRALQPELPDSGRVSDLVDLVSTAAELARRSTGR